MKKMFRNYAFAAVLSTCVVGCGLTLIQTAQLSISICSAVITSATAVWPAIEAMLPADKQAVATRDFNLAILSLSTAESVVQDAITIGSTTDLLKQLQAVDDAITKLVTLVNNFKALAAATSGASPQIDAAVEVLHSRAASAIARNQSIRARL